MEITKLKGLTYRYTPDSESKPCNASEEGEREIGLRERRYLAILFENLMNLDVEDTRAVFELGESWETNKSGETQREDETRMQFLQRACSSIQLSDSAKAHLVSMFADMLGVRTAAE